MYTKTISLFGIFLLSLLLGSCSMAYYQNPQPKNRKNLYIAPQELIGQYKLEDDKDTLTVHKKYLEIPNEGKDNKLYFSDSIFFRQYKQGYFLNFKEDTLWQAMYITKPKNQRISLRALVKDKRKVCEIVNCKKMQNSNRVIINPSRRELKKLFKNNQFTQEIELLKLK